jgi:hypothetical protein
MGWQSFRWRLLAQVVGLVLLCVGAHYSYWWFYELGPLRRTLDPQWCARHSHKEYWCEVQKGIHRGLWSHDHGWIVGWYGDEAWAEWIMGRVKPGTQMGCFGSPCHSATAMQFITNQDVGDDADAWLAWWEKNRSKSQLQWIADGFAQSGLEIDVPPAPEQTTTVLELLGQPTPDGFDTSKHLKYNAFRCLRDTGFDAIGFALSDRTLSEAAKRGLLEYAKQLRRYPEDDGVGILPLQPDDEDNECHWTIELLTRRFQIKAYAFIIAPLALGMAMVAWSLRRRNRHANPRPEPAQ